VRKSARILFTFLAALTAPTGAQSPDPIGESNGITERLLRAHRKQNSGEYAAARSILLQALSEAPASASLLDALGSVQQDMGEYIEAEQSYFRALRATGRIENDPERIFVLNNLGTLYLETHQYSKGQRVREQLERLPLSALERRPVATALLLDVLGSLEHARHRDEQAVRDYTQALDYFHQEREPVSLVGAAVKNNLGHLHLEAGRYPLASDLFRQSIQEIEAALGTDHPSVIRPLVNLAKCENMNGHSEQAEALAGHAVELAGKTFGTKHPVTATAMLEQASALRKLRRNAPARKLEKRARASLRNTDYAKVTGSTVDLLDLASAAKH
jgi:tetratricopeptide (TPR) repeat protein